MIGLYFFNIIIILVVLASFSSSEQILRLKKIKPRFNLIQPCLPRPGIAFSFCGHSINEKHRRRRAFNYHICEEVIHFFLCKDFIDPEHDMYI